MSSNERPGNPATGRIAWITGIACAACCAVPSIGLALGSASIAGLALYSEKAALAIAVLGVGYWAFRQLARKKAPACDIDGPCRPASTDAQRSGNG